MPPSPATALGHFNKLFAPETVAIIGASSDEKKIGNIVIRNIIESGFRGTILPVNPHASAVRGITCYSRYSDIEITPDLAIIAIPAPAVLDSLKEIAAKGTKHVIIFSAGFKEIGPEGEKLENELKKLAAKLDLTVLGPNCLGFVNTIHPINATFGQVANKQPGNLRFISQSGAIATSIFDWAAYSKVGFTDFVTLGNKAVVNESDILDYWLHVPQHPDLPATQHKFVSDYHPVGMYLESIEHGERFINTVHQMSLRNPVCILKPGKSSAARSAMQSHTGALAGDDAVFDAALAKAGAIRCNELEDLFDLARIFAWNKAPQGKKIAIVSNAGGPAVITSDSVAAHGLELAVFDNETKQLLEKNLPRAASIKNPIDVLGDALAVRYEHALREVLKSDDVDAVVVILTPQIMTQITETAEIIGKLSLEYKQPIVCSFMGGSQIIHGEQVLNQYKIPSFRFPERAVKALATMAKWRQWQLREQRAMAAPATKPVLNSLRQARTRQTATTLIKSATHHQYQTLDSFQMDSLLKTVKIDVPPSLCYSDLTSALTFAKRVEFPLVAKLVGPTLLHKTDINGVITNIRDEHQLGKALSKLTAQRQQLPDSKLIQIQLQKQVGKGLEVIIGIKRDPQFGSVLLFGAGGQLAEVLDDHGLLILPARDQAIRALIERSKIYPLLRGFRGGPEYSIAKLVEVIQRLAGLAQQAPELTEIEINPLILTTTGLYAVDGKGVIGHVSK